VLRSRDSRQPEPIRFGKSVRQEGRQGNRQHVFLYDPHAVSGFKPTGCDNFSFEYLSSRADALAYYLRG